MIAQRVACVGLDQHRLAAERGEDVAIGRIAGQRDRDAVARLEQREERQDEAGRRAGGDDDALGIDVDAVASAIVPRDARAQRRDAERSRYSRARPDVERGARRRDARSCGAGAAGWPTSMWMTRPPAASMRAAAAITSITMNGGTSLRADGVDQPSCRIQASCSRPSDVDGCDPARCRRISAGIIGRSRPRNQT